METYRRLEEEQSAFLAQERLFRSAEYAWPPDPLHTWSRVWEYPYVYHHLMHRADSSATSTRIVDYGSGVTFFPFALAKAGYQTTCLDVDPLVEVDIRKAIAAVPHSPGVVDFARCDQERLPFSNGEVDAVYSISVLEHIPNPGHIVPEIARILSPGGLLLLTIDLDMRGDAAIGKEAYVELVSTIEKYFSYVHGVTTTHPADILDNTNSKYRTQGLEGSQANWYDLKQSLKAFLGRPKTSPH